MVPASPSLLRPEVPVLAAVWNEIAGQLIGIAFVLVALILPGLALAAVWIPFTIPARLRRLFEVGPTDHWMSNYLIGFVAFGGAHAAVLGATLWNAPSDDAVAGAVLFTGPLFALGAWAGAAFGLPFVGYDWLEDAVVTRVFLFLGAAWYAAVTTAPLFVLMVFYYFPG